MNHYQLPNVDVALHAYLIDIWATKLNRPAKMRHDMVYPDRKAYSLDQFGLVKKLAADGIKLDTACRFFIFKQGQQSTIHIDNIPPRHCALNFPIAKCEDVPIIWYRGEGEKVDYQMPRYVVDISITEPGTVEEIDRVTLTVPTLINTSIWHSVDNSNNTHDRVIFSLRFANNPTFDDVLKCILGE